MGVMITENDVKTVPRWEWRTFAATLNEIEVRIAAALRKVAPRTSAEIYVLRIGGPQNAKIRHDIFDVKRLRQVDADGLELWEPVIKAKFPLIRSDVARIFAEWQLPLPTLRREAYAIDQFTGELIAVQPHLRVARVVKSRQGFGFAGCIAEFVRLSVASLHLESFSLEHEQPLRILEALYDLSLETVANTNYPRALKRALGLEDDHRSYDPQGATDASRD